MINTISILLFIIGIITGLIVMFVIINIKNSKKQDKVNNILKIKDDRTKYKITFKGRGNRTWLMEKKPYQVSFDEKTSILGLPKSKKFVFLANYLIIR